MDVTPDLIILGYAEAAEKYPHGCMLANDRIRNRHQDMDAWMHANMDMSQYGIRGVYTRDHRGEPAESYGLWVGFKREEDYVKFCLTWM